MVKREEMPELAFLKKITGISWRFNKAKTQCWVRGAKSKLNIISARLKEKEIDPAVYSQVSNSEDFCIVVNANKIQDCLETENIARRHGANPINPVLITSPPMQSQKSVDEVSQKDTQAVANLSRYCKAFSKTTEQTLIDAFKNIGEAAGLIPWGGRNESLIRNRFGRFNYARGMANNNYIDFERLFRLKHLASDEDFQVFLKKHMQNKNIENELIAIGNACARIKKKAKKKSASLQDAPKALVLYRSIDYLFDTFTLKQLREFCGEKYLKRIDAESLQQEKVRYEFARLLCIVGEACKHFSDAFKKLHPELPLRELAKIRDIIIHYHSETVSVRNNEVIAIFKTFADTLYLLQGVFEKECNARLLRLDGNEIPNESEQPEDAEKLLALLDEFSKLKDKKKGLEQSLVAQRLNLEKAEESKKKKNIKKRIAKKEKTLQDTNKRLFEVKEDVCQLRLVPELYLTFDNLKELLIQLVESDSLKRAHNTIISLSKEINLLHKWYKRSKLGTVKRDLALEHVSGIVSEQSRRVRASYSRHVDHDISSTVNYLIDETAVGRNALLAHEPFADNSAELHALLDEKTIPSYGDISSLAKLAEQQIRNITEQTDEWSVEAWFGFGHSHARLQNFESAEECYLKALSLMESLVSDATGVILKVDVITSFQTELLRYKILSMLGECYFKQNMLKECREQLEKAYAIFDKYYKEYVDKFTLEGVCLYVTCLLKIGDKKADKLFNKICHIGESLADTNTLISLRANYAFLRLQKNKNDEKAREIIKLLKPYEMKSAYNYFILRCNILSFQYDTIATNVKEIEALLKQAEAIVDDFEKNYSDVLAEVGHGVEEFSERLKSLTSQVANKFATNLSNQVICRAGKKTKEDIQSLQACLKVQKKYGLETEATYYNLGLIYYDVGIREPQKKKKRQHFETSKNFYLKSYKGDESENAFNFHRQISFSYEKLGDTEKVLRHASAAYCMVKKFQYTQQDIQELSSIIQDNFNLLRPVQILKFIDTLCDENPNQAHCLMEFYRDMAPKEYQSRVNKVVRKIKQAKVNAQPSAEVLQSIMMSHNKSWHSQEDSFLGDPPKKEF